MSATTALFGRPLSVTDTIAPPFLKCRIDRFTSAKPEGLRNVGTSKPRSLAAVAKLRTTFANWIEVMVTNPPLQAGVTILMLRMCRHILRRFAIGLTSVRLLRLAPPQRCENSSMLRMCKHILRRFAIGLTSVRLLRLAPPQRCENSSMLRMCKHILRRFAIGLTSVRPLRPAASRGVTKVCITVDCVTRVPKRALKLHNRVLCETWGLGTGSQCRRFMS